MSTVFEATRKLSARIEALSKQGAGTRFDFTIPIEDRPTDLAATADGTRRRPR